jgi:trans-aconitate 2-methyltransferase
VTGQTPAAPDPGVGLAWAADDYDTLPLPHVAWGEGVLARLGPPRSADGGRAVVVDAGCGTGRDAERLLHRYPDVDVIGLDADEAMLTRARDRLTVYGGRIRLVRADLGAPLPVDVLQAVAPADAVVSVAALHWVPGTDVLARNLARLLRPGGRLVAECGGAGQLAAVDRALAEVGSPPVHSRTFRGVGDWRTALTGAGLTVQRVELRPHPARFDDVDTLARFLMTMILRLHVAELPPDQRLPFARAVAERLPDRTVDYVRLECEAVR